MFALFEQWAVQKKAHTVTKVKLQENKVLRGLYAQREMPPNGDGAVAAYIQKVEPAMHRPHQIGTVLQPFVSVCKKHTLRYVP